MKTARGNDAGHEALRSHQEKVEVYLQDMQERGISPWRAAPLLFRLLWRLGVKVLPPVFLSGPAIVLLSGGSVAFLYTCLVVAMSYFKHPRSTLEWNMIGAIALGGLVTGFAIGISHWIAARQTARTLKLPPWGDYR
jgi:hypothetical protein